MAMIFAESEVEEAALAWLESIGWAVKHGPGIAPDGLFAERRDYREVALAQRLRDALAQASRDQSPLRPAIEPNRYLSFSRHPTLQTADP